MSHYLSGRIGTVAADVAIVSVPAAVRIVARRRVHHLAGRVLPHAASGVIVERLDLSLSSSSLLLRFMRCSRCRLVGAVADSTSVDVEGLIISRGFCAQGINYFGYFTCYL